MNINTKKGGFRGVKRKSLKEDFKIPNVINYNKIAKEGFLSENTEIVTNSLVKRVISAIDGKNRVKSDITPDKKTRPSNNPFTDKFVEELTRGILNENSLIKKSFAGKDIKFNNNGVITNCSVTPDKIGYKFGDFTYNNELVQKINGKIDQKLNKKKPKDIDTNIVNAKTKNLKKEVKDDEISPKSDDLAPRYRNRQERKPRKPREKRKPRLKKEP